jgi:hypothetical protein
MADRQTQLSPEWQEYDRRVQSLEDEGLTRSDAQGCIDAEDRLLVEPTTPNLKVEAEPSAWKRFSILVDIHDDAHNRSQRSGAEDWLLTELTNGILADGVVYLAECKEVPHATEEELRKYD